MKLADIFRKPKVAAALASIRGAFTPEVIAALPEEHQAAGRALAELSLNSLGTATDLEDPEGVGAAVENVLTLCGDSTRAWSQALTRTQADLAKARTELATSLNAFSELDGRVKSGALILATDATAAADLKVQAAVASAEAAWKTAQERLATRTAALATCGLQDAPFIAEADDAAFEAKRTAGVARAKALTDAGFSLNATNRCLLYADQAAFDAALALAKTAPARGGNPLAAPRPAAPAGTRPAAA